MSSGSDREGGEASRLCPSCHRNQTGPQDEGLVLVSVVYPRNEYWLKQHVLQGNLIKKHNRIILVEYKNAVKDTDYFDFGK